MHVIVATFTYYEPKDNLGWLFKGKKKHEYEYGQVMTVLYDEENKE